VVKKETEEQKEEPQKEEPQKEEPQKEEQEETKKQELVQRKNEILFSLYLPINKLFFIFIFHSIIKSRTKISAT